MTEFDSLFRSVWVGEAPPEALCDWLMEGVDLESRIGKHKATTVHRGHTVNLTVAFMSATWSAAVHCLSLEWWEGRMFRPEDFHRLFPSWLRHEMGALSGYIDGRMWNLGG